MSDPTDTGICKLANREPKTAILGKFDEQNRIGKFDEQNKTQTIQQIRKIIQGKNKFHKEKQKFWS